MTDLILFQPTIGGDWCVNDPPIPVGLLYASRLCTQDFDLHLIDQRVDKDWKQQVLDDLKKKPLAFATTAMTGPQIHNAIEISKFVKEHADTPVIWGGIHPTILPGQTLNNPYIDIIVRGEGEETLRELLFALKEKSDLGKVEGISYKKEGNIVHTEDRTFIKHGELPDIPYHLIDHTKYTLQRYGGQSIMMLTSTGCPHKCTYCYNTALNNSWRGLPSEKFEHELKRAIELYPNLRHIEIEDDNMFGDIARGKKMVEILSKYEVSWVTAGLTSVAARTFTEEFLSLIDKSGCKHLQMGVESGSRRILRMIEKPNNIEHIKAFNRKAAKHKFKMFYNFMCGFPTETITDLKQSIRLAQDLLKENKNAIISFFSIYIPYPGTKLYDLCLRKGYQTPKTLEEWNDYYWKHSKLTWISKERESLLQKVYFSALFIDDKPQYHIKNPVLKIAAKAYQPVAQFRLKNLFFLWMPEVKMKDWYESKILSASAG